MTKSQPVPLPRPRSPQLDSEKVNQIVRPLQPLHRAWVLEPARPAFQFCLRHFLLLGTLFSLLVPQFLSQLKALQWLPVMLCKKASGSAPSHRSSSSSCQSTLIHHCRPYWNPQTPPRGRPRGLYRMLFPPPSSLPGYVLFIYQRSHATSSGKPPLAPD